MRTLFSCKIAQVALSSAYQSLCSAKLQHRFKVQWFFLANHYYLQKGLKQNWCKVLVSCRVILMQAEHPEAPCDETNDTTILTGKYVFQSIEFLWLEESNKQTFSFTCHTQVYLLRFGIAIAAFVPAANVNQVRLVSVPYSLRKIICVGNALFSHQTCTKVQFYSTFSTLLGWWQPDSSERSKSFWRKYWNKCF